MLPVKFTGTVYRADEVAYEPTQWNFVVTWNNIVDQRRQRRMNLIKRLLHNQRERGVGKLRIGTIYQYKMCRAMDIALQDLCAEPSQSCLGRSRFRDGDHHI